MTALRNMRVRDAELSVRTSNALCRYLGQEATLGHVFETPDTLLLEGGLLGRKGLKEVREIIELARVNGDFEPAEDAPPRTLNVELRDYFAATAMPVAVANLQAANRDVSVSGIASEAYEIADAMLAARDA